MMIYLYSHGGSGNHGCEAIVRSTCGMLQRDITLFSNHIEQDYQYHLEQSCKLLSDNICTIHRGSKEWFLSSLETKLTKKYNLAVKFQHKALVSRAQRGDIYLSIGGDNYCYEGTDILAALNKAVREKGAKTVLWGCSVEPKQLENPAVVKDLSSFDLITARETISYQALKLINPNTVLVSDPAFTLERRDVLLPDGWQDGNMIGINASPLIISSARNEEIILQGYRNLIQNILKTTNCGIVLIPHVVWEKNDDRTILRLFYDEYKDTGRVILLEDLDCMELKGYIARCRMFIGARTHATIAAYSNCVPTLVLGYSVKSKGIARDLFDTEDNYVLPVQKMTDCNALVDAFQWLFNHEKEIQNHLKSIMPDYIQKAYVAREELERLLL